MGMDVIGKAPTSERSSYFRNNCWWWRPLWTYCEQVAPELTAKVKYGQSNDGDGLKTAEDCNALADALETAMLNDVAYVAPAHLAKVDGQGVMYPFSFENVREFVAFLRDCGGFEIC